MIVAVTGPARSGTHLLQNVLLAGPFDAVLHDKEHGLGSPLEADRTVAITRNPTATVASQLIEFHKIVFPRLASIEGIEAKYPDALWITYEDLCADPATTIDTLATWLRCPPWPIDFEIENQNPKHL